MAEAGGRVPLVAQTGAFLIPIKPPLSSLPSSNSLAANSGCVSTNSRLGSVEKVPMKSREVEDAHVFFCDKELLDYSDIIKNRDLEDLLRMKNEPKPVVYIKKQALPAEAFIMPFKKAKFHYNIKANQKSDRDKDMRTLREQSFYYDIFDKVTKNEQITVQYAERLADGATLNKEEMKELLEIVRTERPFNRYTRRALTKMNIENNKCNKQILEVGGLELCLPGSTGGDWERLKLTSHISKPLKKPSPGKAPKPPPKPKIIKKNLLSSINVSFKPGPLSKKSALNESKINGLGNVELVKLPPVNLTVVPKIGVQLDPNVSDLLKHVRSDDGYIDPAWALFAVSTTMNNLNEQPKLESHTFTLPYQNNREKMLMTRDLEMAQDAKFNCKKVDRLIEFNPHSHLEFLDSYRGKNDIECSVKCLLLDLLQTVGISEAECTFCKDDPDGIKQVDQLDILDMKSVPHFKKKRKHVNELKKLNVTVIDIDMNAENKDKECNNEHCKLGCVCSSLQNTYLLNEHCGLPECMFDCSCNLENISNDSFEVENSKISHSAVVNLQNQMNKNLAKEEQKFQRTVIRSNNQTIVLGARRRGVKFPRRFDEYTSLSLTELVEKQKAHALTSESKVTVIKLPEDLNCEVWCMVHNLYRCFCKGKAFKGVNYNHSMYYSENEYVSKINKIKPIQFDENNEYDTFCSRTDFIPNLLKRRKLNFERFMGNGEVQNYMSDCTLENQTKAIKNTDLKCKENIDTTSKLCNNANNTKLSNNNINSQKVSSKEKVSDTVLNKSPIKDFDNIKLITALYPPTSEEIRLPWNTLIAHYLFGKIHIWLQIDRPYSQFITITDTIENQNKYIKVKNATEELLNLYPPYLRDLVNLKQTNFDQVLLRGLGFAWLLAGTIVLKKHSDSNTENRKVATIPIISSNRDTKKLHIQNIKSTSEVNIVNNASSVVESPTRILNREIATVTKAANSKIVKNVIDLNADSLLIAQNKVKVIPNDNIRKKPSILKSLIKPVNNDSLTIVKNNNPIPDIISNISKSNLTVINQGENVENNENSNNSVHATQKKNDVVPSPSKKIIQKENISKKRVLKKRWFMFNVNENFSSLKIISKRFIVHYDSVLQIIEKSNKMNIVLVIFNVDKNFGVFAVPDTNMVKKVAYLGPYMFDENPDIKITDLRESASDFGSWLTINSRDSLIKYNVLRSTYLSKTTNTLSINFPKLHTNHGILPANVSAVASSSVEDKQKSFGEMAAISKSQKMANANEEDDDDVIVVENKEEIYEISDSD